MLTTAGCVVRQARVTPEPVAVPYKKARIFVVAIRVDHTRPRS